MKNTILALALTAIAAPFTFAAQTAASPVTPAQGSSTAPKNVAKTTTKKSSKKVAKKATVKSDSTAAPAVKK